MCGGHLSTLGAELPFLTALIHSAATKLGLQATEVVPLEGTGMP